MLTLEQIKEIREHLSKAGNPLFFFDNDTDGLCSFILLSKFIGKGKGIAIKSFPALDKQYVKKLDEFNPDYVFILDKPLVSEEFLEEARKRNIAVVWVDHHDVDFRVPEEIYYYNPNKNKEKSSEPTTYLAYQITNKKEDLWLAIIGCIGDNFLPDFLNEFRKEYLELIEEKAKSAFDIYYKTEIGKIARIMNFALKDKTSNVVKMFKILMNAKSPNEILEEGNSMVKRYKQIDKKYQKLVEKAKKQAKEKLLFFEYAGDLSLSGDIANELSYLFKDKTIVVCYVKGNKVNISIRGKKARELTVKAIENLEGATGGGHEEATGAKINSKDLGEFKRRVENMCN